MLSRIQNISFKGIYDFTFPKGTPKEAIEKKVKESKANISKAFGDLEKANIQLVAFDNSMRLITPFENPNMNVWIFKQIGGEDLAKEYVNRNVQKYKLNIKV